MVSKEFGSTSGNGVGNEGFTIIQFTVVDIIRVVIAGLDGHLQQQVGVPNTNPHALVSGLVHFRYDDISTDDLNLGMDL